jgi:hypothetical protein
MLCFSSYVVDIITELLHSIFGLLNSTIILTVFIVLHYFSFFFEIFLNLVLYLLNILLYFIFDLVDRHL